MLQCCARSRTHEQDPALLVLSVVVAVDPEVVHDRAQRQVLSERVEEAILVGPAALIGRTPAAAAAPQLQQRRHWPQQAGAGSSGGRYMHSHMHRGPRHTPGAVTPRLATIVHVVSGRRMPRVASRVHQLAPLQTYTTCICCHGALEQPSANTIRRRGTHAYHCRAAADDALRANESNAAARQLRN